MSSTIAVVRVRGRTHVRKPVEDAMKYIGLTRKNRCTLLEDNPSTKATISKIKDYVTWGTVNEETIYLLLKERGRTPQDRKLTDQYVKENSRYQDIKSLAEAISKGEAKLKDVKGMKRYFRLNPPKKGFETKGIKKPYNLKGALGPRGDKIGELLARMM